MESMEEATPAESSGGNGQPADHAGGAPSAPSENNPKAFYASQFMQPEWMTDVPPDLSTHW